MQTGKCFNKFTDSRRPITVTESGHANYYNFILFQTSNILVSV